MKKILFNKLSFVQIILVLVVLIYTSSFAWNDRGAALSGKTEEYINDWYCAILPKNDNIDSISINKDIDDSLGTYYEVLPKKISVDNDEMIVLSKKLPEDVKDSDSIALYVTHQFLDIYIDGKKIDSFDVPSGIKSGTTGEGWVFINLSGEYSGKIISIKQFSNYSMYNGKIMKMYYGDSGQLYMDLFNLASVTVGICIFLIGAFMIMLFCITGKKYNLSDKLLWLGLFSVLISIWTVTESGVVQLLFGHHLLISQVGFFSMILSLIPALKYYQRLCEKCPKYISIFETSWRVIIIILCILQIIGLIDVGILSVVSMSACLIILIILICFTSKESIVYKAKESSHKTKYIVAVSLLSLTLLFDIFRVVFKDENDAAYFCRFGFFMFIIITSAILFEESIMIICENSKLKKLEEEAMLDALTKTSNRRCFEKDCANVYEISPYGYSIVMFDLNDLKFFNDRYGHSQGDYYIIICSEIIQDVFGAKRGDKIYRIGGDEFCAVMTDLSYDEFITNQEEMNHKVEELSKTYFDAKMGIAAGYARFDANIDVKFSNTVRRADMSMYENKVQMKEKGERVYMREDTKEPEDKE